MIGLHDYSFGRCGLERICTVLVAVALAVLIQAPQANAQNPGSPQARELVIGTKVAPPFAMKAKDGTWHGISIDLWRHIADQIHLRYRFQETTLNGLIDGVADHSLDAAVSAVTITGPRERVVDFTQPFYNTGLGIADRAPSQRAFWCAPARLRRNCLVGGVGNDPDRRRRGGWEGAEDVARSFARHGVDDHLGDRIR
jgi:ABC-type amino acid transport substrate-binding protein